MIAIIPFILIVLLILCVYFFIRNCYVYQFRNQIIDLILDFENYDGKDCEVIGNIHESEDK